MAMSWFVGGVSTYRPCDDAGGAAAEPEFGPVHCPQLQSRLAPSPVAPHSREALTSTDNTLASRGSPGPCSGCVAIPAERTVRVSREKSMPSFLVY